ncbi:MAG: nucleotide-binding protein [Methanococcoides sp.]|nr:nucleotide-binding protein [Methanococcoides sp.]
MSNYTIFFSWQSDLPNNTNRNFIQKCLLKSMKKIKNEVEYSLEFNLDRDTKSELGTPDIAESIFKKIDKCSFFVADISIINGTSRKFRKTPNPNVLIELGYAAKKLGWDRIICLFNTDYGKPSDLPFDLRNRRVIQYSINSENKQVVKKNIEALLYDTLTENYKKTIFSNELIDYYNFEIYLILLRITVDFSKILFGYSINNSSTTSINNVLNMDESDVETHLKESVFIGFQLFKSYYDCREKLADQLEKIVPLKNYDDEYYVPLVRLIGILQLYDKELSRRGDLEKLNNLHQNNENYGLMSPDPHSSLPNRFVLIRKLKDDTGVVTDFGDIKRKYHIANLTQEFRLADVSLRFYKGFMLNVLREINSWIDNNNGEFLLDDTKLEIYGRKLG